MWKQANTSNHFSRLTTCAQAVCATVSFRVANFLPSSTGLPSSGTPCLYFSAYTCFGHWTIKIIHTRIIINGTNKKMCFYHGNPIKNSMTSVRKRTIPTERPPLVSEVSANILQIEVCHVVSVTNPYGRILGFLDRNRYIFLQVAPRLYSRGWVTLFQTHYFSENLVAPGIKPGLADL
jgi:hypothetical protein